MAHLDFEGVVAAGVSEVDAELEMPALLLLHGAVTAAAKALWCVETHRGEEAKVQRYRCTGMHRYTGIRTQAHGHTHTHTHRHRHTQAHTVSHASTGTAKYKGELNVQSVIIML